MLWGEYYLDKEKDRKVWSQGGIFHFIFGDGTDSDDVVSAVIRIKGTWGAVKDWIIWDKEVNNRRVHEIGRIIPINDKVIKMS